MRPAPALLHENERLAALAEYQLVEDRDDLGLDNIVRLAAQMFAAPIVLVSLVERDRQFFKARIGIDICATDRDVSFCAHALGLEDALVVYDAALDMRFMDNPLVVGKPFIRFYAGMPLRNPEGHVLGTLCVIDTLPRSGFSEQERRNLRDLSRLVLDRLETRRLSVANQSVQSRFVNIAATSPDGVICADGQGRITFWNQSCERLFGFDAATAVGAGLDIIVPVRLRGGHGGGIARVAGGGRPRLIGKTVELEAAHADGTEFPIELSLSMWQEDGQHCFGAIIRDIRLRRADEARMFELAFVDSLSLLPNRGVLMSRVADLKALGEPFALMMLDLDGFKDVNDTLGHHAGDSILRQVAARLLTCVRSIDTVARLGGDEFAVLLPDHAEGAAVRRIGACMLAAVAAPIEYDGQAVHVTASIGAALFPDHGEQVGDLLAAADLAMYQSKADGRNCMSFFAPHLRHAVMNRRAFEGDIRRAIERQEFELFYQPQMRPSDGALTGVEALLRWRHPVEGLLSPARFLPTIEAGPFAGDIGLWVMATACAHAVHLRRRVPGLTMGVNLFGAQFRTGELARDVVRVLDETGLAPDALELEITENIILRHDDLMLDPLRELRAMGVGIAFDDFGTGYASLSMLKRYPLTRLKIDRSFVDAICTDAADSAIVDAMVSMASKLGLEVIAEGVETAEQRDLLVTSGCNAVQGYLYGRPMSVADLDAFIDRVEATAPAT